LSGQNYVVGSTVVAAASETEGKNVIIAQENKETGTKVWFEYIQKRDHLKNSAMIILKWTLDACYRV